MNNSLAGFITEKIKEKVEQEGYIFHELFFDGAVIYASKPGNNNRIELDLCIYLYTIHI